MQAQSDQLGPNTPDPHPVESEHEDQRPRVRRPSNVALEHQPEGGQDDEDIDDLTQSNRSRGKSWCSGYTSLSSALTVTAQLGTEAGSTGISGVPHSSSISPRGQPKHLVHSKPSWDPSPVSMPNIRSNFDAPLEAPH